MNDIEEKNKTEVSQEVKDEAPTPEQLGSDKEEEKEVVKKKPGGEEKKGKKKGKKKGEKEEPKKERVAPSTVVEGSGVNLIPTMSEEEVETVERKTKVNLTSLVSLSLLFSISILVVGFNIISRIQLNNQKERLSTQEREVLGYSDIITGNIEITERIFLYKDIEDARFSTKLAVDHLRNLLSRVGGTTLGDFSFPGGTGFQFRGQAQSLEDVSKLWFIMLNDEKLESVDLRTVSKSSDGANFSFRGQLVVEEFVSSNGVE